MGWGAGHGGDIAEAACECFTADKLGFGVGSEVDALDDGIGFQEERFIRYSEVEDRAVVAWADEGGGVARQVL